MKRRISRDRRRAGVRVALTSRDAALLRALARFRLARTSDLLSLIFRGIRRDTAAARLRRLHDAGFVEARMASLNEQNVYQLGPEGRSWADDHGVAAGVPPAAPALHHLEIVRLWTRLATALSDDLEFRLARFEPDWEVRSRLRGTLPVVVPDAVVEIAGRNPESTARADVFLEVDLTTERAGTLRRKLAGYQMSSVPSAEGSVLAVVLIGAQRRRESSVREMVAQHWLGRGLVCLESAWPDELLALLRQAPLTSRPSGKGSVGSATPSGAEGFLRQGEGPSRSGSAPGKSGDE